MELIKKILLGFIFIVLFSPIVQHAIPFIKSGPLHGAFDKAPDVRLNIDKWMDGSYQDGKTRYINDNISFRADLIRLNCQVDYSVFHQLNTGWGVIGKNNCMLDEAYIDSWSGADYTGYDAIYKRMIKLKALQDTFGKMGKSLILVHAASKGYFYEDCIPDRYKPVSKKQTNFETCLRICDSLGINQVNLNSWFCAMKDTSKELLYPKQGIHWSMYGGMLAGDSLIRYIERLRKINMPHPKWINIAHTTKPGYTDDDIASALNLIWPCTTETFTYGTSVCDKDSTKTRPAAVYIGDSFMWALIDNRIFDCINDKWEFWFYFKNRCNRSGLPRDYLPMDGYNWQGSIDKADYVVLLYTSTNINRIGDGFIDAEYQHYFPGK